MQGHGLAHFALHAGLVGEDQLNVHRETGERRDASLGPTRAGEELTWLVTEQTSGTPPLPGSSCFSAPCSYVRCRGLFRETAAQGVAVDARGEAGRGSLVRPEHTWYPNWL